MDTIHGLSRKMFVMFNKIPYSYHTSKKKDEEYELIIEIYGMLKDLPEYIRGNVHQEDYVAVQRLQDLVSSLDMSLTSTTNIEKYREMDRILKSIIYVI